ncbi:aminotransferase DegT [Geothermobacter hydrogeniphilus]|uniref:Aminotransferase DegT n=1 Tax=Geothermobacter hydrogeniphilus TaxID=1969733 RepID=A0A2K2H5S9_9BACT|nr:DegT/DnrJ/EryC1/StrS family aminotransferase [Geothermobacter hydrogeniphilus]PNU18672.1 aminotransferase DegT [Geothermobacter hydrogeniphilus]
MQFIDLKAQQERIRPQIDAAIKRVLDHGQYIMGPEVFELERQLAEFVGVRHAIGCSSGTDALLLGLMAYEVGPGDAVFTTPFTFFATCEVIALLGATPVFVDIDPRTFNIDPIKLGQAIERVVEEGKLKVRGIIPVDLYGLPADYDAIMPLAEKHGLFVLEDAAQAFGATYKGRKAPGLGHVGTTSFFPAKPLGCYGDGGAVFTDDDDLAEKIRSLLVHGKGPDKYNNVRIGLNARLDTIQAAILIEKLKIYPEEIELRQVAAERYSKSLCEMAGVMTPHIPDGYASVWAQYTIQCQNRDDLQFRLSKAAIPTMVYYVKPVCLLDAMSYLNNQDGSFPVAEKMARQVLSLPIFPYLAKNQQFEILAKLAGKHICCS